MGDQLTLKDLNYTISLLQSEVQGLRETANKNAVDAEQRSINADAFFLILMAIIIYFMQCGFAFLECGAVRSKNATNILIKNILDSFIGAGAYWIIGWPFAFGDGNKFIGHSFWVSHDMADEDLALFFFHFVFAATAATIVSGAMAERCDFMAYVSYSFLITGVVYPVVTHWAWSGDGWLAQGITIVHNEEEVTVAYRDFAGSGVVHLLGGTAALIGAAFLGPRIGRFEEGAPNLDIKGHSVPLAAMGGFILFFGFFAFNAGSQASISAPGDAGVIGLACVNTIISGASGAVIAMILNRVIVMCAKDSPKWSLLTTINGGLTGMVAICAGCNAVHPWGALIIGMVAGLMYLLVSWIVVKLKIDDPLDAVAVHGGGGLWGILAVPIFAREQSIIFSHDKPAFVSLGWNLVGGLAIIAWTAVLSIIIFGSLKLFKLLRVSREIEENGLDIPKHGEPAYPIDSWGDGWSDPLMSKTGSFSERPTNSVKDGLYSRRPSHFFRITDPVLREEIMKGGSPDPNSTAVFVADNSISVKPVEAKF